MAVFSAVINTWTNEVKGLHVGKTQPIARPDEEFIEVTEAEYATIGSQLGMEQGGGPAWEKVGTNIVLKEDTRPQLRVTLDKTEVAVGEPIQFDFQVLNKDGNPITPNVTRKLFFEPGNGSFRGWRVTVVNGVRSGLKDFVEAGNYRLTSDTTYRIVGDTEFQVFEDF